MKSSANKTLVVVLGATATGKTAVSIALARAFGSEILSCDSRQFYRQMPIGTAAPTAQEQAAATHHFIATRNVEEDFSCGQYEVEALELLDERFREHDLLFMVGGSGLYVDAVCRGLDSMPEIDPALRAQLTERLHSQGLESLLSELSALDPEHHARMDRSNPQRVVRALEVCLQTGHTYSSLRMGEGKSRPFRIIKIGIRMPREVLYERINQRVDLMVAQGLESEARTLYPLRNHNALQTVGYKEFFAYFDGLISREEAIELIKRNSRRYAKRQETWFLRDPATHWIPGGEHAATEAEALLKTLLTKSTPL